MMNFNIIFTSLADITQALQEHANQLISQTEPLVESVTQAPAQPVEFGMAHLIFNQGDFVLKSAFFVMLLMSVLSWSIILYRSFSAIRVGNRMKRHMSVLNSEQCQSYEGLVQKMSGYSPVKQMILEAIYAKNHFKISNNPFSSSLNYSEYLMRSIRHSLDTSVNARDGGLTVLASIGATAPFVGLFGTVWGIYHTLINIAVMGNVNIATISGPIGEALIATAFGLFVAIPAVLAYNALNRTNRVLGRRLDGFAHDV